MYGVDIDLSYHFAKEGNYRTGIYPPDPALQRRKHTEIKFPIYSCVLWLMFIFFQALRRMSLLLRLPIKTAIFIKASCSLVRTLYLFYTPNILALIASIRHHSHYVFLGGQKWQINHRHVQWRKGLSAGITQEIRNVFGIKLTSAGQNDDANKQIAIVLIPKCSLPIKRYSTGSQRILANVRIGFYHKEPNIIITEAALWKRETR